MAIVLVIISLIAIKQTSLERQDITIVEKITRDLYTPLQSGVNVFRGYVVSFGEYFVDKKAIIKDNKRLETQIKSLSLENQKLREYKYETKRLRTLMDFKENTKEYMVLVPAQVIARSPNTWYETITIDKGSLDGIKRDMVAITPNGLVGRVTSVSLTSSVILLITDLEGAVGAITQETRTPGIIQGVGNSSLLSMDNIPYYSEIRRGNRVVTSRLSEIYPPGILIGKVKSVHSEPNDLIKTAVVVPAVDFDKLEEVLLVKEYTEPPPETAEKAPAENVPAKTTPKTIEPSETQPVEPTPTEPVPPEPTPVEPAPEETPSVWSPTD